MAKLTILLKRNVPTVIADFGVDLIRSHASPGVLDEIRDSCGMEFDRVVIDIPDQHGEDTGPRVDAVISLWSSQSGDGPNSPSQVRAAICASYAQCEATIGARVVWAYAVSEVVQWDYHRTWEVGEPSPGVKQISFLTRLQGLTLGEFDNRWRRLHTPLAKVHHPAIWRYVQNLVEDETSGLDDATKVDLHADGIAELHFRTSADRQDRFFATEASRSIIISDIRQFASLRSVWDLLATEYVVRSGSAA
jgi:hypothetical protein